MSSDSSPCFPPELEREILETTAYLHPDSMPSLVSVCRRAYDWVSRIKYHTVAPSGLQSSCPFHVLQRAIQSNSKPTSFFRDRVRHLFIPHGSADELRETLSTCSSIKTLAIGLKVGPSVFRGLDALRPSRLNIRLVPLLDNTDLCRPTFAFVTHLRILDFMPMVSDLNMARWLSFLSSLPALTHLAIIIAIRVASDVFVLCKNITVLVHLGNAWGPYPPEDDELTFVDDDRFVYMPIEWDYLDDWVTGTRGGLDFWARADKFIAMKRRGKIEPR